MCLSRTCEKYFSFNLYSCVRMNVEMLITSLLEAGGWRSFKGEANVQYLAQWMDLHSRMCLQESFDSIV